MTGLEDAARQFVGVLESLRIPYAIMGGLAVRVHALPRPTFDVDFTVSLPRESLGGLYEEAEKLGFIVPDSQLGGWVDQVHGLPVVKVQLNLSDRIIPGGNTLPARTSPTPTPVQRRGVGWLVRHSGGPHLVEALG